MDTKRIPRGWFPEYELVLESAWILGIFSLWKCKEGATNIFWHPKNKKRLINQSCRGGETGRRARLKIWFQQWSVGSSPTLGTNISVIAVLFTRRFKMYANQNWFQASRYFSKRLELAIIDEHTCVFRLSRHPLDLPCSRSTPPASHIAQLGFLVRNDGLYRHIAPRTGVQSCRQGAFLFC